jgi:hypothetical protein
MKITRPWRQNECARRAELYQGFRKDTLLSCYFAISQPEADDVMWKDAELGESVLLFDATNLS